MRFLKGSEEEEAIEFLTKAARLAAEAPCGRSKCASIIVSGDKIIGEGFNSPPGDLESQKRCSIPKDSYHEKVTDKTCCVHAEQRAIINALKMFPGALEGSRLYFVRLDEGGEPAKAGAPYCTICSKMALDVGIKEFVLWHEEGVCVYDTEEYNLLSFEFGKK